jgi:predicted dehydrogenase
MHLNDILSPSKPIEPANRYHRIMNKPQSHLVTRRQFLSATTASVAAFQLLPRTLLQGAPILGANDKLNVAGIGIGGQGGSDIDAVAKEGHNLVALCDVDETYAAKKFAQYPKAKQFKDFRVMLDQMHQQIDAVVIGTPDHTHAVIALEAMKHHKHVYCEKPLAHTVHEVRRLIEAANKYKVVTQLGNQGHSFASIRRLCEWVWGGAIGQVHTVHAACDAFKEVYCQYRNLDKLNQPYDVPKGLDYNLWVGPVPFIPYTPFWVPWNWRGWLHFGTGTIGDWFCHVIDPTFWALDLDAPTSVQAEVTNYDPATNQGLTYPPASKVTFQFPARGQRCPLTLVWYDGNNPIPRPKDFAPDDKVPGTGAILFGDKGMIMHGSHGASGCRLLPESVMQEYSGKNALPETLPRVKNHAADWIEAIRAGKPAGSNFGYGGRLTQVALLGAIAIRFPGQTLNWDNQKAKFTNHDLANQYVNPAYRKGWKL